MPKEPTVSVYDVKITYFNPYGRYILSRTIGYSCRGGSKADSLYELHAHFRYLYGTQDIGAPEGYPCLVLIDAPSCPENVPMLLVPAIISRSMGK